MLAALLPKALAILALWCAGAQTLPTQQIPIQDLALGFNRTISTDLFYELEELSRIVDISYCVGTSGIQKPFLCASRCQEFPDFELVRVCVAQFLSGCPGANADTHGSDLAYRSSSCRFMRLHCRLPRALEAAHHSRLSRHVLRSQHHHRSIYSPSRIHSLPGR